MESAKISTVFLIRFCMMEIPIWGFRFLVTSESYFFLYLFVMSQRLYWPASLSYVNRVLTFVFMSWQYHFLWNEQMPLNSQRWLLLIKSLTRPTSIVDALLARCTTASDSHFAAFSARAKVLLAIVLLLDHDSQVAETNWPPMRKWPLLSCTVLLVWRSVDPRWFLTVESNVSSQQSSDSAVTQYLTSFPGPIFSYAQVTVNRIIWKADCIQN